MCGITGYINIDGRPLGDTKTILDMLRIQKHRGPDDTGIRAFNLNTGESSEISALNPVPIEKGYHGIIGFNRLSILDLSLNGHQPMISPDKKVILALNGEIYNAFDFKPDLMNWGFHFKSSSDTEIVLALYLKYGLDGLLLRLNGMFAIVIIDLAKNKLYIIRDRFGIKPLYYIHKNNLFAFSSEIKCFQYLDGFTYKLAEEKLDEYLIFRNNLNGTLFHKVDSLKPGHYLHYEFDNKLIIKKYFDINDYTRSCIINNKEDYSKNLEQSLSKSVQSQLMSDVKLGCQLSGGIDSSLVTLLANRKSYKGSFEAVSIILKDQRFSEEKYIDKVTESLGIISHKFLLDSTYYFNTLEKVTWHLEAPINHPNTVGIYKLSQCAKEFVTVLLSGEGADEVFGGYNRFYNICYPYTKDRLVHLIKRGIENPRYLTQYFNHEHRAIMSTAFMTSTTAMKVKADFSIDKATSDRRNLYHLMKGSLFDRQVKYEISTYLPDLLIRQDKMSMAHSIENRVPFLDNEVVEFSFKIPENFLLLKNSPEGTNTEKYLLKKIIAKKFGDDFAFRNKMGFGLPIKEFFLNKNFLEHLNDQIIPNLRNRNIFNYKLISGWLSNIEQLGQKEIEALWVIISFEIWASIYLKNNHENRNT